MCGILGSLTKINNHDHVQAAAAQQFHRGPDSQNIIDYDGIHWSLSLAHQRLSIIDLSDAANQPFADNLYSLVYNGEVYNFSELRLELEKKGIEFKTQSDTEVVFESLKYWGVDEAVKKFNGFWAFAFFDIQGNKLHLSRDRFGIKPLYYYINEKCFYFSSEIKTLLKLTSSKHRLNKKIIASYIEQNLLESYPDETFYLDIFKIPPGHNALIDLSKNNLSIKLFKYYSLEVRSEFTELSISDAQSLLLEKLERAIHLRLRSDVPIGILLSGGLDSSSIASISEKVLKEKTKLLSYVSDDKTVDESYFIDLMSASLNHEVLKVKLDIKAEQAIDLIKKVTHFNDQPIHSFSAMAHYLLMEKAKQHNITVILSGQGADETLCGYRKFTLFYLKSLINQKHYLKALIFLIKNLIHGEMVKSFSLKDARRYLPHFFTKKSKSLLSPSLKKHYQAQSLGILKTESLKERQIRDVNLFSVPSLLHYEDRMSMAHAREIRVPFLDHNIVEFFISLPNHLKLKGGWTKYILRKSLKAYLPKEITWRRDKKGFTNPQAQWLRNDLKSDLIACFINNDSPIYKLDLINKENLLEKYKNFCENPHTKISERDIFTPFALNLWLEINFKHIDTES
jgi:asparagine synthase (glutamine-hydrolysing)